jgi:endonuclease/exonuclease/phosphatase (EEP) superfamily protein YafD
MTFLYSIGMPHLLALGGLYGGFLGLMAAGPRLMGADRWRRVRSGALLLLLLYPAALLLLMAQQILRPQSSGMLAVAQVFAPWLFAPLLPLIPFGFFRGTAALRTGLAICALVFALRFINLPRFSQPDAGSGAIPLTALNWNLGLGTEQAQIERARAILLDRPADIVVLEEAYWRWIEGDAALTAIYPYRRALYYNAETGLVLLSAYPISADDIPAAQNEASNHPRQIVARLDINGTLLNLVITHPPPPSVRLNGCRLICYDTADRDAHITQLRAVIDPLLGSGEPLLVLGDFNTTRQEPTYRQLSAGLSEAQDAAGSGAGLSWPLDNGTEVVPPLLTRLLPLIRIDHQFSNDRITPLDATVDCTRRGSDHCAVWGRFEIRSAH